MISDTAVFVIIAILFGFLLGMAVAEKVDSDFFYSILDIMSGLGAPDDIVEEARRIWRGAKR